MSESAASDVDVLVGVATSLQQIMWQEFMVGDRFDGQWRRCGNPAFSVG
jgi:hypothetical protein